MPFVLIVAIALAVLGAFFAIQNSDVVSVSFLGWEWEASLAIVLLLTLGVGVLIGYLATIPSRFKVGAELRREKRKASDLGQPQSLDTEDPAARETGPGDR